MVFLSSRPNTLKFLSHPCSCFRFSGLCSRSDALRIASVGSVLDARWQNSLLDFQAVRPQRKPSELPDVHFLSQSKMCPGFLLWFPPQPSRCQWKCSYNRNLYSWVFGRDHALSAFTVASWESRQMVTSRSGIPCCSAFKSLLSES